MERILFLAHVDASGGVSKGALEALRGAVEVSRNLPETDLVVGLIGRGATEVGEMLGGSGAEACFTVSDSAFESGIYASDVAAAEAIVRSSEASVVIAPATSRLLRALPGLAQRLEGRVDTHVTGISIEGGAIQAERWFYRQRMRARFTRTHRPWVLILDGGVFDPWHGESAPVPVKEIQVPRAESPWRTRVVGEEAATSGTQTIRPDASLLLVAGAGWTKKQADGVAHVREAEDLLGNFLEISQASLGSSKSLVDQSSEGGEVISFMTHLNQVGQTGATPRHPKGLSTCCHGEEPHVVGWRFIQERRAINLDPNCGWAQGKTDVLYVADAFSVMAKVNELLSAEG